MHGGMRGEGMNQSGAVDFREQERVLAEAQAQRTREAELLRQADIARATRERERQAEEQQLIQADIAQATLQAQRATIARVLFVRERERHVEQQRIQRVEPNRKKCIIM